MATATSVKMTATQAQQLWAAASAAARKAFDNARPTPMVVGTPTTPLGSDIDYTKQTYFVPDGVCGFGWLTIRPARGALVTYLKSKGIGYNGYYGGWQVGAHSLGVPSSQSYERNYAAACAAAEVLRAAGVQAFGEGRLD